TAASTADFTAAATASFSPSARPSSIWSRRWICSLKLGRLWPLRPGFIVRVIAYLDEFGIIVWVRCAQRYLRLFTDFAYPRQAWDWRYGARVVSASLQHRD